ncbi:PhoH family protein [Lentibacter sp. XHP0401]|jgi:phosphate starvation-inducible protein PhoH and related proteins|uniref:PhoH family protein n=1 Tax=Lentibacter sp. XHP0401 TaxID=2984334 RepID=UPI0021E9884A|nr:PhoH family protein [Lentibacter sp. XHP0401]MCV2894544.1 PhoH family protein [Lentibacter sp. XHP0401]
MTTSTLPPAGSTGSNDTGSDNKDILSEVLLDFPDNRLLIELCGEFDRNLADIEQKLAVQILRRGNHLAIIGDAFQTEGAAKILQTLYARLEEGRPVEAADIDREFRMDTSAAASAAASPAPAGQMEMFKSGRVEIRTRKKTVEPRTAAQKTYVENLFKSELGFGIGPAGTGKTYLAVAVGVNMFMEGHVDRIILSRPAVEAGEKLGYLPGDMKDKVDPYMQPLYDALNDFMPAKQLAKLLEEKRIEIAPLAFMRGRTLSNAFVVLDEAQNATAMQMKMFLTRLGEGSRMVITGDRSQVDLPAHITSGLTEAERLLKRIPDISFNYFTADDVVRHPLVAAIIKAYDADAPLG